MSRRQVYPLSTWIAWILAAPALAIALGVVAVALADRATVRFDDAGAWWLVVAAPMAGLLSLYGVVRRRRALHRFASAQLAPMLANRVSPGRQAFRAALPILAIVLIVSAIIGPRWGIYLDKQKVHGVDIVIALDVSRSMLAGDVTPTRLAAAKHIIRQQLTERAVFHRAHRLGLLAFAGSASLRVPLTTDHLSFRTKLDAISVNSAPRGGTAIAQALEAAGDLFARSTEEATKIVLLFTDGEDHEGDPVAMARMLFEEHGEQGIQVFTIGVGDPSRTVGAEVPSGKPGKGRPLLHDGQIVFSKIDVEGLRKIAAAGGGRYAPIEDFRLLVDALANMRSSELSTEDRIRHKPRYQWFLAAALLLMALEMLTSERGNGAGGRVDRVWQQEKDA